MTKKSAKYTFILMLLTLVMSLGFTSCGRRHYTPDYNVLVIHEGEGAPKEYGIKAEQFYYRALKKNGILNDVDVKHFYLEYPQKKEYEHNVLDSLSKQGWMPNVIVCHKDVSVRYLNRIRANMSEEIQEIPMVYTGVRYPEEALVSHGLKCISNVTGYKDSVDLGKNLLFFQEVTGDKLCTVVVDSIASANKPVYHQLRNYLKLHELNYINNMDCHIDSLYSFEGRNKHNDGRMIVTALSFLYPNKNGRYKEAQIQYAMATAKQYRFMQVIFTAGSQELLNLSAMPQLSVINTQFDEKRHVKILGGYFVSQEQEVNDAVTSLARIVKGEDADDIPLANHKAEYWLDYNAMKMWDMKYSDWEDKANIINAPLRVSNPVLWYGQAIVFWGLLLALLFYFAYKIQYWVLNRKEEQKNLMRDKQYLWLLTSNNSALWKIDKNALTFRSNMPELKDICDKPVNTKVFREMIHPGFRKPTDELVNFRLKEGLHRMRFKLSLDKGRTYQWWECIFTISAEDITFRRCEGRIVYIEEVVKRESELENQLQAAEETKLKQSFLANISHDIRNPLSSIVGFSELLISDDPYTDEEKTEFTEIIRANTDIMLKLIDDVADVSKIQVGEYRFMLKPIPVSMIIETAYAANAVLSHENQKFIKHEGAQDVFINVDFERTLQVMNNYLSNAFKYTPNGTVIVGWKNKGEWVELYVHDSGMGMSQDKQLHVFDQYYMGDAQHQGTGLGLYIVKMMVEQQGGMVGVESFLNKGSYFYARFPITNREKED